ATSAPLDIYGIGESISYRRRALENLAIPLIRTIRFPWCRAGRLCYHGHSWYHRTVGKYRLLDGALFQNYSEPLICPPGPWTEGELIYSPGFPFDASTPCDFILTVDAGKRVQVEFFKNNKPNSFTDSLKVACIIGFGHFEDKRGCWSLCDRYSKLYRLEIVVENRLKGIKSTPFNNILECAKNDCMLALPKDNKSRTVCRELCANLFTFPDRVEFQKELEAAGKKVREIIGPLCKLPHREVLKETGCELSSVHDTYPIYPIRKYYNYYP
ncbi:hypothetical protein PENTCL1PPCAC_21587, partial [Pristionchus entomophagus]